jgi:hypothetical protein
MHVVIDLGEMHTYLACWEKGKSLEDACIKVKLPGIAAFKSTYGKVSWERDNLREYFSYLYREYLMPSRIIIESVSLATPNIFDLQSRRTLLDILEEIFGLYEASIVPRPVAVISGIQMGTAFSPLSGDVLFIEEQESTYQFAFISIVETIGITLEKQSSGELSDVMAEAEQIGYYGTEGWQLDHIVLAQNHNMDHGMDEFIALLPPDLNVIYVNNLQFTATEGLAARYINSTTTAMPPFNIIYPYEFYLEINKSASLERIPFDTANLELDCSGRYSMISFNQAAINNLTDDKNRVCFRFYEIRTADSLDNHEPLRLPHPVLEINSPQDDLPPYFELGLNMAAAIIQLDLIPEMFEETTNSPEVLGQRLRTNQQKLYQILSRNKQNEALLRDWSISLLSPHEDTPALYNQIDQTLFHLYGLLKLWQNQ